MSHGHGHGPKFYKENLALFLQLFLYQYKFPFFMGVVLPSAILAGVAFIPGLEPHRTHLLLAVVIIFGIALLLLIGGLLWRMFFITSYTAGKSGGDFVEELKEIMELNGHASYTKLIIEFIALVVFGVLTIFLLRIFNVF